MRGLCVRIVPVALLERVKYRQCPEFFAFFERYDGVSAVQRGFKLEPTVSVASMLQRTRLEMVDKFFMPTVEIDEQTPGMLQVYSYGRNYFIANKPV
jgi:hypothetical protein